MKTKANRTTIISLLTPFAPFYIGIIVAIIVIAIVMLHHPSPVNTPQIPITTTQLYDDDYDSEYDSDYDSQKQHAYWSGYLDGYDMANKQSKDQKVRDRLEAIQP